MGQASIRRFDSAYTRPQWQCFSTSPLKQNGTISSAVAMDGIKCGARSDAVSVVYKQKGTWANADAPMTVL